MKYPNNVSWSKHPTPLSGIKLVLDFSNTTTEKKRVLGFICSTDDMQVGMDTLLSFLNSSDSTKLSISTSSMEGLSAKKCLINEHLFTLKTYTTYNDYAHYHLYVPLALLSSIIQPSFPKVTITNLTLGNLKSIEMSACGTVDAPVHAC